MKVLSKKELVYVSFMLFSMFFGAGNLIFPPFLGRSAGSDVWFSLAGFVVSAVGLPILAVMAIAKADSFRSLAERVNPMFAFWFPLVIYVSIGPGIAIPRAGSLAFEMCVRPFLSAGAAASPLSLLLYTIVFFGAVYLMSLSPLKLVDRFGKLLTPLLLTLIAVIFVKSLFTQLGDVAVPQGNYATHPVFQGVLDGYQTMDAIAALVFGIVVATTLRSKGVEDRKELSKTMMFAGIGAGILLTAIYLILGHLGSTSASLGSAENGAQVLNLIMHQMFGGGGTLLLGLVFTVACLCVSIGLVTSTGQYFAGVFPRVSYKAWVSILCLVSLAIANVGLTQILKVSVPILGVIYPIAIVLVLFGLLDRSGSKGSPMYVTTVALTGLYSFADMVNTTFLGNAWAAALGKMPLHEQGIGWLLPAVVGVVVGWVWGRVFKTTGKVVGQGV